MRPAGWTNQGVGRVASRGPGGGGGAGDAPIFQPYDDVPAERVFVHTAHVGGTVVLPHDPYIAYIHHTWVELSSPTRGPYETESVIYQDWSHTKKKGKYSNT